MDVIINLYMLIKDMFPMMLVLSLACTLAAHAYYSMQLPPIHCDPLFALPYVPTCWSVPYLCTFQQYYAPATHVLGARILITPFYPSL